MINQPPPLFSHISAFVLSALAGSYTGYVNSAQMGYLVFLLLMLWFYSSVEIKELPQSYPILFNLKTYRGIASKVRYSVDTSGTDSAITTYQVATFTLSGIPVEIRMRKSVFVEEGDNLVVSGMYRHGVLYGQAYKNITRNIVASTPIIGTLIVATIFLLAGVIAIPKPDMALVAKFLLGLGLLLGHMGFTPLRARRKVKAA